MKNEILLIIKAELETEPTNDVINSSVLNFVVKFYSKVFI